MKPKSVLETLVNLSILAVAGLLIWGFFNPKSSGNDPAQLVGTVWAGPKLQGDSLVMAVQPDCHFCSLSFPFYQRLSAARGAVRLVAVVPDLASGSEYLAPVVVDQIAAASFRSIGVRGTPTLFWVHNGTVQKVWVGKLSTSAETEVMKAFQKGKVE